MIRSFKCPDSESLYLGNKVLRFNAFARQARRKLRILDASHDLRDLMSPPGNQLEKLKGDRKGQYSIRVNGQWRICFEWGNGGAVNVEIVDYHD